MKLKGGFMKKPLFILFFVLVFFNILNIIDKTTTYFGIKNGFVEINSRAAYLFNSLGLVQTLLFQIYVIFTASFLVFLIAIHFSEKIKNIGHFISVPTLLISAIYIVPVINNVRLLL